MALTNIQSLKPKLDMLIHHMQPNNLDICFITETWTQCRNESDYQYIRANLDTAGYNIMTPSRENRKGGGIAVIYRPHLHVKKYSFDEHTSFEAITINLNMATGSYLLSTIYRVPYSKSTGNNANLSRRISRPHFISTQKFQECHHPRGLQYSLE